MDLHVHPRAAGAQHPVNNYIKVTAPHAIVGGRASMASCDVYPFCDRDETESLAAHKLAREWATELGGLSRGVIVSLYRPVDLPYMRYAFLVGVNNDERAKAIGILKHEAIDTTSPALAAE